MTEASIAPGGGREAQEVDLSSFLRLAVRTLIVAVATVAAIALWVRMTGSAGSVRTDLRLGIGHPPQTFASFGSIVLANLRVALGPLLIAALAQIFLRYAQTPPRALIAVFDVAVVYLALSGLLIELGASIGAYGSTVLVDVLSHGPLELSGFALFWSVYFGCRRCRVEPRVLATLLLLAASLIVVAAAVETWAHS